MICAYATVATATGHGCLLTMIFIFTSIHPTSRLGRCRCRNSQPQSAERLLQLVVQRRPKRAVPLQFVATLLPQHLPRRGSFFGQ